MLKVFSENTNINEIANQPDLEETEVEVGDNALIQLKRLGTI